MKGIWNKLFFVDKHIFAQSFLCKLWRWSSKCIRSLELFAAHLLVSPFPTDKQQNVWNNARRLKFLLFRTLTDHYSCAKCAKMCMGYEDYGESKKIFYSNMNDVDVVILGIRSSILFLNFTKADVPITVLVPKRSCYHENPLKNKSFAHEGRSLGS